MLFLRGSNNNVPYLTFYEYPPAGQPTTVVGGANIGDGVSGTDNFGSGTLTTTGYTTVSSAITPGETTLVVLVVGQSNSSNYGQTRFDPNMTKVNNLNPYDGLVYKARSPMLGAGHQVFSTHLNDGCLWPYVGKLLVDNAVFQRVIFCPVGIGSAASWDWAPSGKYFHRALIGWKRIQDLGYDTNVNVTMAVFWCEGVEDSIEMIDGVAGVTAANFKQNFQDFKSAMIARGFVGQFWMPKETFGGGTVHVAYTPIRTAIDELISANADLHLLGDYDGFIGADYRWERPAVNGVHFSNFNDGTGLGLGMSTISNLVYTNLNAYY